MTENFLISKLKQTNISVNADKSKIRVEKFWKNAPNSVKKEIVERTNISRVSFYRIFKTGSISAKLAVPLAEGLNVNPFYLTGETDENSVCSDALIAEFLTAHGYENLVPEMLRKASRGGKAVSSAAGKKTAKKTVVTEVIEPVAEAVEIAELEKTAEPQKTSDVEKKAEISYDMQLFLDTMTEDDMILLMRSILLRAKAGGSAAKTATELKLILLQ